MEKNKGKELEAKDLDKVAGGWEAAALVEYYCRKCGHIFLAAEDENDVCCPECGSSKVARN